MIYLAILLILTGLLIVLIAFFVEVRKDTGTVRTGGFRSDFSVKEESIQNQSDDVLFPEPHTDFSAEVSDRRHVSDLEEEDVFISFDEDDHAFPDLGEPGHYDPIPDSGGGESESLSDYTGDSGSSAVAVKTDKGRISSVLFDDKSNIIDYDSGSGVIDATLGGYKRIRRIGSGLLGLDSDGINFYIDEKLYRFDFHSIHDLWSGNNFIALPLKGSGSVKLFLFDGETGFPAKAESFYFEYMKG